MTVGGIRLKERVEGMAAVAAVPGVTLGLLGDVFTPVGGWVIVAIVGALALLLAVCLYVKLTLSRERFFSTFVGRITTESEDWRWIWNPSRPVTSHALHMMIVFGVICLLISGKSVEARAEGGLVAANVPAAAAFQQQIGLTEKLVEEARKTNRTLESIDSKADNFKRESSDDPPKDLVNSGVLWESVRLERAIADGDIKTVRLFLLGGMPLTGIGAAAAFEQSAPLADLVSAHASLFDARKCEDFFWRLNKKAVLTAGAHGARLVTSLCSNDVGRTYASNELARADNALKEHLDDRRKEAAARKPIAQCVKEHLNDGALTTKAMEVSSTRAIKGTLSEYEYMLFNVQSALVAGRSNFQNEIQEYCKSQTVETKSDGSYENNVSTWKKIGKWVN